MTGADLRRARRRLGLTQMQLGKVLLVDESTVYRWENSRRLKISPLHLELIQLVVAVATCDSFVEIGEALLGEIPRGSARALYMLLKVTYEDWDVEFGKSLTFPDEQLEKRHA